MVDATAAECNATCAMQRQGFCHCPAALLPTSAIGLPLPNTADSRAAGSCSESLGAEAAASCAQQQRTACDHVTS